MIDWINDMCRSWGRQKWALLASRNLDLRPPGQRKDGPPFAGAARGIAGRVIEEGAVGAAIHTAMERAPPEVLTGDALKVAVAIQCAIHEHRLTERQHEVLIGFYVVRAPFPAKLRALHLNRAALYERLHRAHVNIEPWLGVDTVYPLDGVCGLR